MHSVLKKFSFAGRCLTESLTFSTSAFVCILLAVPLKEHGTDLYYLLPVMLFYACMKAGLYLLQGAVHIVNPYKMLKYGIITALTGSFFLLNADPSDWKYLTGAMLSGFGLAPMASMYKQISDSDEESLKQPTLRKFVSTAILFAFGVYCMHCKGTGNITPLYLWCVYLALITAYIVFLPGREKYSFRSVLNIKDNWFVFILPALLLFFMMAAVSGYKSSGNRLVFILMAVSLLLFIIWSRIFDKRVFHAYCSQTAWLGAIRGFEMLFALVFLAESGQGNLTMVLYEVIVVAGFFGFLPDFILRKCSSEKTVKICMLLALTCMIPVISRNIILMFSGVFLCVCFTNKAKNCNLNSYLNDGSVIQDEYRLRQDKMYAIGNGSVQAFTMIVFYITGKLISGHGSALMKSYVFNSDMQHSGAVLLASGIICILGLLIWLIFITRKSITENISKED